jgi:hypothetical protein
MVVAVAGEVLILGTTATDLVPLGKIADPDVAKRLMAEASALHSAAPTGIPESGNLEEISVVHAGSLLIPPTQASVAQRSGWWAGLPHQC